MSSSSEPTEAKAADTSLRAVTRKQIHIRGIVQRVGSRLFVYHLAQTLHLTAYILNSGVANFE